ncbi:acyl carrier protein [Thiomicrospira sp. XS5]|jgi:acyl carrier protein|uniref:Acyl carrier protein n=1 Tax=Hydrogenovibrio thermophilus TaxID=265883 RepID=A0A451G422_9GAMM|nr:MULTISPECIES: phosphopantetheine-binding protein [Piscirickettsiaceae]AZR80904.1 acyl carrier protein [Thiomicrospira sp. S5]KUJ74163.1 acyl carrier protein [Thiomicrospira sp. XS5]QAB14204.1 acyl carrier protein [Hydrogenovibrio thermophilus]
MTPEQTEIAEMIIEAVNLEDVTVDEIDPNEPIFNDGLGLDSIDALEISLELNKRYGIKIKSGDQNVGDVFASIAALSEFVQANKQA